MADSAPTASTAVPPALVEEDPSPSSTTSPARGAEMRDFLQARLQKNRAPPLVHGWDFYHDRQDRVPPPTSTDPATALSTTIKTNATTTTTTTYEQRLEHLATINDVRQFWSVFNNFDIAQLSLRDSIHLFHRGVKPLWEDPRNTQGGSWTFRVAPATGARFWHEVCLLAIGEQLQAAVASERTTFRDDVCGVSLSVRFNSVLIQVWNRDGLHTEGIERLKETVVGALSEDLEPREGSFYYKRHCEHAGFAVKGGGS